MSRVTVAWSCRPRDIRGLDAADQVLFHIRDPLRYADCDDPRELACLQGPELAAEPQGVGAVTRGARKDRSRRYGGVETSNGGNLVEQIEIVEARQAVGADGDPHAGAIEARDGRVAGA